MPVASLNPFRTLQKHRNFRLFWLGQTLSLIGTWMQSMAQGWLALELSDSAFVVGLVSFAGSLPVVLLSLHAGVYVDRYDKLRIVRIAQTMMLLEAAALWWFVWSGHMTIGWLLALATLQGVLSAIEIPARQSLMIELVGREDLREAIALNSSGFNLARIVGPWIGAAVITYAGLAWCFAFNALSYLAVLISLGRIRLPARVRIAGTGSPAEGIRELWRYMRGTPEVAVLMTIVVVFSVCGVPYLTLLPVVARDILRIGASGYGLLLGCVGIGGLAGALSLAAFGARFRRGMLLSVSNFVFPALLVLFALSRSPRMAYPLLLGIGFTMIINNALANSMLQSIVPDALRGRLMSAYSLAVVGLSQVIGALLAGAVARAFGVAWAIGGAAAIMLGFAAWVHRTHPELRSL